MRTRILKVGYVYNDSLLGKFVPYIKLGGRWLQKLGFNINDKVEVLINNENEIIIRKVI